MRSWIKRRFFSSSDRLQVFSNVAWSMVGKLTNLFCVFLTGVLVARFLGAKQFGLMSYVINFVTLFSLFADFGMQNVEIREMSKRPKMRNALMGTAFTLKIICAIITLAAILIVSLLSESSYETVIMIMVYSVSIIMQSFSVIRNYFTSIVNNKYVVQSEMLRSIIGAGIKVLLILLHASLMAFIIASAFDFVLVAGGYIYSYRKKVGSIKEWIFSSKIACYYLRQSAPLMLSGVAYVIYQRVDQVIIGQMIGVTSVGYFSAATRISDMILFLPQIIVQTVSPLLVRAKEKSESEYRNKVLKILGIINCGTFLVSSLVSIFAYWIVIITFGMQYLPSILVLQILAFKAFGMALSSSGNQIIVIESIQKYVYLRNLSGAILCVTLNILLIPKWGIVGSAIVGVVSVLFAGWLCDLFIPQYRKIFFLQTMSLIYGWKELFGIFSRDRDTHKHINY